MDRFKIPKNNQILTRFFPICTTYYLAQRPGALELLGVVLDPSFLSHGGGGSLFSRGDFSWESDGTLP